MAEVVDEKPLSFPPAIPAEEPVVMPEEEVKEEESVSKKSDSTTTTLTPPISSFSSLSLSIWPPSQRTREAVILRLIETLTTPSVLTKRYGTLSQDDASSVARNIEEEAFTTASAEAKGSGGDGANDKGMEILQIYSKEISRRMIAVVKERASAGTDSSVVASDSASVGGGTETSTDRGGDVEEVHGSDASQA